MRGHEAVVEAFRRAVRRGRLAHAYLFAGLPGVGKRAFAMELAKALLCERTPAGARQDAALEACDRCPACVQVEAGTHPDFTLALKPEDAHEFPIEVMREVCRGLSLKPKIKPSCAVNTSSTVTSQRRCAQPEGCGESAIMVG